MDPLAQQPENKSKKAVIIGIVIVFVALTAAAVWYFAAPQASSPTPPAAEQPAPASALTSLGAEVFEKANNPIKNRLPDTVVEVPNPVGEIYKNPFE